MLLGICQFGVIRKERDTLTVLTLTNKYDISLIKYQAIETNILYHV